MSAQVKDGLPEQAMIDAVEDALAKRYGDQRQTEEKFHRLATAVGYGTTDYQPLIDLGYAAYGWHSIRRDVLLDIARRWPSAWDFHFGDLKDRCSRLTLAEMLLASGAIYR